MRLRKHEDLVKYVINSMDRLERFLKAQEQTYSVALKEIQDGKKIGHWIWYIFPQLKGLGRSYNSNYYGITDKNEAKAYLNHPILAERLGEITEALLALPKALTAKDILGGIDAMKVKSSMTLFYMVSNAKLYKDVLVRYYQGKMDNRTLCILNT